jgi:hypothetical protein
MNPYPNSSVAQSLSNSVVDACRGDRSKTPQQATPDKEEDPENLPNATAKQKSRLSDSLRTYANLPLNHHF